MGGTGARNKSTTNDRERERGILLQGRNQTDKLLYHYSSEK